MATSKQEIDTDTGEVLETDSDQPSDESVYGDIEDRTEVEIAAIEEEINESLETDATVSKAADTVGRRLLSAFIDELTAAGVKRNKDTEFVLERLGRRIRTELRRGYLQIMARDVPAVPASMGKVVLGGDKIQATVNIDKHIDAKNRHALADFAGSDVLIVMADDVEEHLGDMDELAHEAAQIQQELPLSGGLVTLQAENSIGELETIIVHDPDDPTSPSLEDVEAVAAKIEETDIDPSRLILKDGEVVGLAPDPECEICGGAGGFDVATDTEEGVDEWVRCECVELPLGNG